MLPGVSIESTGDHWPQIGLRQVVRVQVGLGGDPNSKLWTPQDRVLFRPQVWAETIQEQRPSERAGQKVRNPTNGTSSPQP